jgi:hypothetical protein
MKRFIMIESDLKLFQRIQRKSKVKKLTLRDLIKRRSLKEGQLIVIDIKKLVDQGLISVESIMVNSRFEIGIKVVETECKI